MEILSTQVRVVGDAQVQIHVTVRNKNAESETFTGVGVTEGEAILRALQILWNVEHGPIARQTQT